MDAIARNELRAATARVPRVAIFAFAKRFEQPSLAEGFAEIWRVHAAGTAEAPAFELEALA
jgi:hypothetical protein